MLSGPDFKFKKIVIVFINKGEKIRVLNDNLIVEDSDGKVKIQTSCYRIFSLWIVGNFSMTKASILRAKKFGYSIIIFSHSFRVQDIIACPLDGNTILRRKQYTNTRHLELARWVVSNKIENQYNVICKIRKRALNEKRLLVDYSVQSINADNDTSLLGIEGSAARIYFSKLYEEYEWKGRKPRVKHDINNCLLDIGYTVLFSFIEAMLLCYGFDNYVGFYHKIFYQRKSLVCDLVEPFRCIIDYKLKKMNSLKMIDEEDFLFRNNRYDLAYKSSSKYVGYFMNDILERKDDIFLYIQKFYRCFMKDVPIENFPTYEYK